MKKLVLIVLMIVLMPSIPVFALDNNEEMISEQLSVSGIDELLGILPENSKEYFSDGFDSKSVDKITFTNFFGYIFKKAKERILKPISLFLTIIGILIISSVVSSLKMGKEPVFSSVISLSISTVLASSVIECITNASQNIKEMSYFIMTFIPVFSGVLASSGKVLSSVIYQTTVFSMVQLFSQAFVNFIVPILGIFLAVSIVGSSLGVFKVDGLTKALKTTATWTLTFCMTVFVGILTIKGVVSTSADTVTVKATKFVISSFVPIVGGALSEAYNSLYGCMGVVKSTVGVFGIIAIVISYLPMIIEIFLMMSAVFLSSIVIRRPGGGITRRAGR